MQILSATVNEFGHEEQCAIYYHHFMNLPLWSIARTVQLSEGHVVSAINLFAARLDEKLDFFKKVQPHDANDVLPVRDILLPWSG